MKNIILFLILFSATFSAQQNLKINGKIINSDKEKNGVPIVIYLLDNDNQLLKSTIAQDSKFEFDQRQLDNYHLQLSSDETIHDEKPF